VPWTGAGVLMRIIPAPPTESQAETADTALQSAPECSESTTPDPGGAADCDSQRAGRPDRPFERGKEVL
jgi:hypothetical protein